MTPSAAVLLADYNRWMNERMYAAAATLAEAELKKDRGAFFGSIFQTLTHIAVGDTVWMRRFAQHPDASALHEAMKPFSQPTSLRQELASSLGELQNYRERLDAIIVAWSRTLTAEQLAAPLSYSNMAGEPFTRNFGHLAQHMFNHQTHHRGQASTLLFQAGVDIGVTDLFMLIPSEG